METELHEVDAAVLRCFKISANAAEPCPSNTSIARVLQCHGTTVDKAVANLVDLGLIEIYRINKLTRIVTIVSSGRKTRASVRNGRQCKRFWEADHPKPDTKTNRPQRNRKTHHHQKKGPTTKRMCLRCQEDFDSAWVGNRICGDCSSSKEAVHSSPLADDHSIQQAPI